MISSGSEHAFPRDSDRASRDRSARCLGCFAGETRAAITRASYEAYYSEHPNEKPAR
jgi:hypothetical protein